MEVVEAGLANDIFWLKSQYINNGLGCVENVGFGGEVYDNMISKIYKFSKGSC